MDHLEVVDGQGRRKRVSLDRPRLLLGREPTCDIHLPHPGVSRRHAQLQRTDQGSWLLQDLRSRNTPDMSWQRISQDFGVPHPTLAETSACELINMKPLPFFGSYSSNGGGGGGGSYGNGGYGNGNDTGTGTGTGTGNEANVRGGGRDSGCEAARRSDRRESGAGAPPPRERWPSGLSARVNTGHLGSHGLGRPSEKTLYYKDVSKRGWLK